MAGTLDFSGVVTDTIKIISGKTKREFALRDDIPVRVYLALIESQIRNQENIENQKPGSIEAARAAVAELESNLSLLREIFADNGYSLSEEELRREFDMKEQQRILNVFFNSLGRGLSGTEILKKSLTQPPEGAKRK